MANTKCEGCGERRNAWKRKMASSWLRAARSEQWSTVRGGELRRRAMGKRERRRGSARGEEVSVARRADKRRACKREAKGWCALHKGEQRQEHAAATAAVQRLADTPRNCYIRLQKILISLSFASNLDGGETTKTRESIQAKKSAAAIK
jgi:hypothetical protein